MTETQPTIMERLKKETWDLHQQAEASPVEQSLIKGTIKREHFAAFLAQRYLVHRHLDASLRRVREANRHLQAVVRDHHFHTASLEKDLRFYGVDPDTVEPTPGTQRMNDYIDTIEKQDPAALLGIQYVFEGSTNGARFIARAIRMAYGLEDRDGTRYLDPYGDAQRVNWGAFRETVNALSLTPAEQDAIVHAARQTFQTIIDLEDELEAQMDDEAAAEAG